MASILLAVVEREVPSSQRPPWSSAKLVCSGGVVFVIAAVLDGYNNKTTFVLTTSESKSHFIVLSLDFIFTKKKTHTVESQT